MKTVHVAVMGKNSSIGFATFEIRCEKFGPTVRQLAESSYYVASEMQGSLADINGDGDGHSAGSIAARLVQLLTAQEVNLTWNGWKAPTDGLDNHLCVKLVFPITATGGEEMAAYFRIELLKPDATFVVAPTLRNTTNIVLDTAFLGWGESEYQVQGIWEKAEEIDGSSKIDQELDELEKRKAYLLRLKDTSTSPHTIVNLKLN